MVENIINVKQLTKITKKRTILSDITFQIQKGDCVAVIGPNGAGKTTLFNCLLGDYNTAEQAISIFEQAPKSPTLNHRRAVLFQENRVEGKMTVLDLIRFQQEIVDNPLDMGAIQKLLGFSEQQYHQLAEKLSGGQKRLLSFVLILIRQPELLFLDEPTSGMDTSTRKRFWAIINDLKKQEVTILYSSHYIEEVEHTADRVLVLSQGKLIRDTTPYAMSAEEQEKIMTIPFSYRSLILSNPQLNVEEVVEKRDSITFVTKNPKAIWECLEAAACPIDSIEMTNRTLLDRVFATTKG
ncbi:ABC transporter ATP-binding protein [Streptococcus dysgalactiae subsp. dysgalactiae]|uniref:ABC transporter ATP-binding protein n=1 Tax=Streptococcus dysgalactiae TaxID=1334 RepID=UPI0001AABADE|nr:ABC transporter ATP-binding protein [Streptococcus dysgalactiae]MBM6513177.1 ABC transporter ATP-binding protein [Streptococcus dysgalactiae subsp. equisimilis]MBM6532965.1 ABC transporter ATP-binding protein [Streptococcus dysgalactiae subsp. equisimilis]QGH00603.1 ABC transporter ATP-binding protein [Streptococcus dysgalactiae subsp. dysgalactiae]BAH82017.1 multi drug transport ATP-binding protein [Streptococcus dysgalactiae subsp. equisimilis GGS_124]